jgi:hypothetical protein
VRNIGKPKSLLRASGAAKDDSDVLIGKGSWGFQDIINALQLLYDELINGELDSLMSPNGLAILSGLLWTTSGIETVIGSILAFADPAAAGAILAGNLINATLNIAAGATSAASATGSSGRTNATAVLDLIMQLETFKTDFQEAGGDIEKMTFVVQEVDKYAQDRVYYSPSCGCTEVEPPGYVPSRQNGVWKFVGYQTDYSRMVSAAFTVDYYYQG